jgi:hypothetical protein
METSEADVEELAKVPEEDEEDATAVPPSVASTHDTKMPAVSESLRSPSPEAEEYIPQWWTDASPASEARYASEIAAIRASFKDEVDEWDPSMVSEYSDEIFEYMGGLEMKSMPDPNYMETQNEIQWHQRTTLVDWLVQIHARYHLTPETLWIAVNIIDRFLSKRVVSLVKLQLVGVTAMFIAAKYEEIVAPSVDEVCTSSHLLDRRSLTMFAVRLHDRERVHQGGGTERRENHSPSELVTSTFSHASFSLLTVVAWLSYLCLLFPILVGPPYQQSR